MNWFHCVVSLSLFNGVWMCRVGGGGVGRAREREMRLKDEFRFD